FIMIWIIPKFKVIFEGFDAKLPAITLAVINASDVTSSYWYLLVLFPAAIVGLWLLMAISLEAMGWGPAWSKPVHWIYDIWPRLITPLTLRSLSLPVETGQPLAVALTTLAERHPDKLLRGRIQSAAEAVARGDDCWSSLRGARLIRPGEATLL